VQVLRTQLLALMAKQNDLHWRDIAIMAPDIDIYAPFFAPVFGQHDGVYPILPFSFNESHLIQQSNIADVFFRLLDLAQNRLSSNDGFELLSHVYVAKYYDLHAEHLERIHYWLAQAAVRWGVDATHREQIDGNAQHAFTWRQGLIRLLYGYATEDALIGDIAPASCPQGQDLSLLDTLFEFVTFIDSLRVELRKTHCAPQWVTLLQSLLERFTGTGLLDDKEQSACNQLNLKISRLQEYANPRQELTLELVRAYLQEQDEQPMSQAWLSGHISICKMVPMRLIPFKVICLLGLDETSFPRQETSAAINRLSGQHADWQLGDRNNRHDDRFLFLQLLSACQNNFMLFYIGGNPHNNSINRPSVLITELLDTIGRYYGEQAQQHFILEHPIHDFEQARTTDTQPASETKAVQTALFAPLQTIFTASDSASLSLNALIRFWQKPLEYLARTQQLRPPNQDILLNEQEPYGNNGGLEKYQLIQHMLANTLQNQSTPDALQALLQAQGLLAPGALGRASFEQLYGQVRHALADLAEQRIAPVHWPFSIDIGMHALHGEFIQHFRDGIFNLRLDATLKGRDHIYSGINALAARASGLDLAFFDYTDKAQKRTMVLSPQQAQQHLAELLHLYYQGQSHIVCFHRTHSFAFYTAWRKDPDLNVRQWLQQACIKDEDNDYTEHDAYGDFLPFGDGFLKRIALADPEQFQRISLYVCPLLLGITTDA
jgi:exodeoxyribonuclease V gamma subunit